ncbi:MAG: hypothetical protein U1D28_04515 [Burkholderiales bacterium]|nr:hypothetical protein [Burkholderiales bacterium]
MKPHLPHPPRAVVTRPEAGHLTPHYIDTSRDTNAALVSTPTPPHTQWALGVAR